jgi:predicted DNA-binding protein with PD1-like motif
MKEIVIENLTTIIVAAIGILAAVTWKFTNSNNNRVNQTNTNVKGDNAGRDIIKK